MCFAPRCHVEVLCYGNQCHTDTRQSSKDVKWISTLISGVCWNPMMCSQCWDAELYEQLYLQYRYLIPAPVDRTTASAWLYIKPLISSRKISQAHPWPAKLANQNFVHLWGHPCIHAQETNWVAMGCAVVYYAWAAHAFSAGSKCRNYSVLITIITIQL